MEKSRIRIDVKNGVARPTKTAIVKAVRELIDSPSVTSQMSSKELTDLVCTLITGKATEKDNITTVILQLKEAKQSFSYNSYGLVSSGVYQGAPVAMVIITAIRNLVTSAGLVSENNIDDFV